MLLLVVLLFGFPGQFYSPVLDQVYTIGQVSSFQWLQNNDEGKCLSPIPDGYPEMIDIYSVNGLTDEVYRTIATGNPSACGSWVYEIQVGGFPSDNWFIGSNKVKICATGTQDCMLSPVFTVRQEAQTETPSKTKLIESSTKTTKAAETYQSSSSGSDFLSILLLLVVNKLF